MSNEQQGNGAGSPEEIRVDLLTEELLGVLEGGERLASLDALRNPTAGEREVLASAADSIAQLALLAPAAAPPPRLKQRIMATTQHEKSGNWISMLGYAASVALMVSTAYLFWQYEDSRVKLAQLEEQQTRLQRTIRQQQLALQIVGQDGIREVQLNTAEPDRPVLRAFWSQKDGLVLVASNLLPLPDSRTYQLWLIPRSGSPVSAGTFQPGSNGAVLHLHQPRTAPADNQALAITNEPAAGSAQPTSTPIWVGSL